MALIFTTKGDIEESLLDLQTGGHENDDEICTWQEYYLDGELVKREAQLHLKKAIFAIPEAAQF
jgi:hypothetical protein